MLSWITAHASYPTLIFFFFLFFISFRQQCKFGEWEDTPATPTSDRVCLLCSNCPANRFVLAECHPFRDTQCQGCTPCTRGQTFQVNQKKKKKKNQPQIVIFIFRVFFFIFSFFFFG